MLSWCLRDSLQRDGSFRVNIADGPIEDAEYYGTAFLSRIGFFNAARRFWTEQAFPESADVKKRIQGFVLEHRSTGSIGDGYKRVTDELGD